MTADTELELYTNPGEKADSARIFREIGILPNEKVVGINPSATFGPAKQWLPERFAKLADRIRNGYGARIIIFGGPGDRQLGNHIARNMKTDAIDLSGKTTLNQAIALIERCHLFVTNDSGLMHIAAALNRPLVAIFGSTDYAATRPFSSRSILVRSSLPCSPCLERYCPLSHNRCMKEITVEKVFKASQALLERYYITEKRIRPESAHFESPTPKT